MAQTCRSFTLEDFALRSYNYFERLVDAEGLPYFNVFWTEPASAAHDWPDFGDVMARQLQGAIMARHMTGHKAAIEDRWRRRLLSLVDPSDGLLYRPRTSFSEPVADMGDQSLTLYALVTAYADAPEDDLAAVVRQHVDTLLHRVRSGELRVDGSFGGFGIKSYMAAARQLRYEPALELAGRVTQSVFDRAFTPDNRLPKGAHMHGSLRTLVGAADYALAARDPELFSRVDALFRDVQVQSTRFGYIPEQVAREGDIVLCETCALMDYVGLAVTLANHGHREYWDDVERVVRNQLVESQVTDASWLHSDDARADTEQFTWRDIAGRVLGAWSGWSSPNHILAAREHLHWGGPELRGQTRALQNCCGGSGPHALFIAWRNAARYHDSTLWVNLHIDKCLPEAEIRCQQPYRGVTTIALHQPCRVRVRVPGCVTAAEVTVTSPCGPVKAQVWGNYLDLGEQPAGQSLVVAYPLHVRTEEERVGNPGWRQYRYNVTWKGDTVVDMMPVGNEARSGWSDFEQGNVETFYGPDGPGPLYRRGRYRLDLCPEPAPLHPDDGSLDHWWLK
jgi:hypothetical protein